jgi:hypothetical protein
LHDLVCKQGLHPEFIRINTDKKSLLLRIVICVPADTLETMVKSPEIHAWNCNVLAWNCNVDGMIDRFDIQLTEQVFTVSSKPDQENRLLRSSAFTTGLMLCRIFNGANSLQKTFENRWARPGNTLSPGRWETGAGLS